MIMISNKGSRVTETVKLLKLEAKEPAVLMDCAIVCYCACKLTHTLPSEIGSEGSNWRAQRMQSKVSEGSDSSFLPINFRHCLTQLVVTVKCASHHILQYGGADGFDSPYCAILWPFQSNSI